MKPGEPTLDISALAGLRPYHLPDAPAWWPPAFGWWLLAVLLIAVAAATTWWFVKRRRRQRAAREALRELATLRERIRDGADMADSMRNLSRLLRRFALAQFRQVDVAALTGEDWLAFLDLHGGDGHFSSGPGRQLVEAPYRQAPEVSVEQLARLVEEWVQHNQEVRS